MSHEVTITPSGHLALIEQAIGSDEPAISQSIIGAFSESGTAGMLHLATNELQASLPRELDYVRSIARSYFIRLCQTQAYESAKELPPLSPPSDADITTLLLQAPPMRGLEYLNPDVLREWWTDLDSLVRDAIKTTAGGAQAYLSAKNPAWRFVGRVTFHLAENKKDPAHPFAFLATYASKLSAQGRVQHEHLGQTLQQHAGAKNRQALLALLVPIQRASERSSLVKELVESGGIYQPLVWTPQEAHRFLQDIPILEECGLIVRVPDWWKPKRPPRAIVNVRINGSKSPIAALGSAALLDFSVHVALDGEPLTTAEMKLLLASADGLVNLKGKWVEVDRAKLEEALKHWQTVEQSVRNEGLSFFEGMRLLAGASLDRDAGAALPLETREWTGLSVGPELEATLARLRSPETLPCARIADLHAELRPYQQTGVAWLRFLTHLGLGACLADDMGLGKTVQVIALLLAFKPEAKLLPHLLVVPASLIANWKAELIRFAPRLRFVVAHSSESHKELSADDVANVDLVITTYGMLTRLEWLREHKWELAILDEAQAIKNAGTAQTRAVKELKSKGRIAMTGTPIENRLSDLWSLFDFLNPGLLGSSKAFSNFIKKMDAMTGQSYQPLRSLVQPYILRRMKTDKHVIKDLPEKTEINAYCGLTRKQAALYQEVILDLREKLELASGIQRRGMVLRN